MAAVPRVFLDASALITASASPSGGSALAAQACTHGLARALMTRFVLLEAERNLHTQFPPSAPVDFYNLIGGLNPEVIRHPSPADMEAAAMLVAPKDAHVLAGARAGQATHLLTLDRKHFLGNHTRAAILPIVVCSPAEFLSALLALQ